LYLALLSLLAERRLAACASVKAPGDTSLLRVLLRVPFGDCDLDVRRPFSPRYAPGDVRELPGAEWSAACLCLC